MSFYPALVEEAMKQVKYPGTGINLVESGMIADDIRIDGKIVSFSIVFEKANDPFKKSLIKAAEAAIIRHLGDDVVIKGNISAKVKQAAVLPKPVLPNVAHVIAVASGKGGVGKSTVSVNLAVSLAMMGYQVGLLDADIYGPSIPKMFHVEDAKPEGQQEDGKEWVAPIEKYGIKMLSIGFFVEPDNALIWRGAMAVNAIKQLVTDGLWGNLDYLIIDLPPGTGDIHLSLVQMLHLSGAVIVTTPQEVALADARKGINMFMSTNINVPVLGLIENMSWFTPAELPNNKYYLFGKDGGKLLAEKLQLPLLGQIPIVQSIREGGDAGVPVALDEHSVSGLAFHQLAQKLVQIIATKS